MFNLVGGLYGHLFILESEVRYEDIFISRTFHIKRW